MSKTLIDLVDGATWPHLAVENRDHETLNKCRDVDLICVDCEGETPLHYAASNNDVETCRLLVNKNPKLLDMKCIEGYTPYDYVLIEQNLYKTHIEVCNYFLGLSLK